jgi:hypothetical protein
MYNAPVMSEIRYFTKAMLFFLYLDILEPQLGPFVLAVMSYPSVTVTNIPGLKTVLAQARTIPQAENNSACNAFFILLRNL